MVYSHAISLTYCIEKFVGRRFLNPLKYFFQLSVLNPGISWTSLLFLSSPYTFFEYLCSLLRNSGDTSRTESLHYLTALYISFHSRK